jgi:hypothetical protein
VTIGRDDGGNARHPTLLPGFHRHGMIVDAHVHVRGVDDLVPPWHTRRGEGAQRLPKGYRRCRNRSETGLRPRITRSNERVPNPYESPAKWRNMRSKEAG